MAESETSQESIAYHDNVTFSTAENAENGRKQGNGRKTTGERDSKGQESSPFSAFSAISGRQDKPGRSCEMEGAHHVVACLTCSLAYGFREAKA